MAYDEILDIVSPLDEVIGQEKEALYTLKNSILGLLTPLYVIHKNNYGSHVVTQTRNYFHYFWIAVWEVTLLQEKITIMLLCARQQKS